MVIHAKLISAVSSEDADLEMINAQTMIDLSTVEQASRCYEDVIEDYDLIDYTYEDEGESIPLRSPLLNMPFREEWLPKFRNPDHELVNESLWVTKYWFLNLVDQYHYFSPPLVVDHSEPSLQFLEDCK